MRHGPGCSSLPTARFLGVVNIVPQFALIIATVVAFYRLDSSSLPRPAYGLGGVRHRPQPLDLDAQSVNRLRDG